MSRLKASVRETRFKTVAIKLWITPKLAFTAQIVKATKPHEFQSSTNLKWPIAELSSQKITASLNALLSGK
ncbi:hypothetical protein QF117_04140 [Vibrio sp. YMD68]|uniref:hypothetical protein n=1 Tax=Vibrio sp. YMD68 TaxID=3042300 RepID=UPI002499BFEF|nr:hypothetical protein [Vibrio sp. YMD68]WGV98056.1 hypothetical protein QF117_04140 [Vibrio sp. YMD68]